MVNFKKGPPPVNGMEKTESPKRAQVLQIDPLTGRGRMHTVAPDKAAELEQSGPNAIAAYLDKVFSGLDLDGKESVKPYTCLECSDTGTLTVWLDRTYGTYPYGFRCGCGKGLSLLESIIHHCQAVALGYYAMHLRQVEAQKLGDISCQYRSGSPDSVFDLTKKPSRKFLFSRRGQ